MLTSWRMTFIPLRTCPVSRTLLHCGPGNEGVEVRKQKRGEDGLSKVPRLGSLQDLVHVDGSPAETIARSRGVGLLPGGSFYEPCGRLPDRRVTSRRAQVTWATRSNAGRGQSVSEGPPMAGCHAEELR